MVEQQQTTALAVVVAFQVLGTIFVILRIWSRFLLSRGNWGGLMTWSDIFVGLGWLCSIGQTVAVYQFTVTSHSGYHLAELITPGGLFFPPDPTLQVTSQKWLLAMELTYNPILACVKNAAILFYLRLGISKRHLRLACYVFLAINNAILIAIFFSDLFQCTPVSYKYNYIAMDAMAQQKAGADANGMVNGRLITGGKCINKMAFVLSTAGLTCFTDILVIAIPITMVWGLQMKTRKKIMVALVFCFGLFVTMVGVARIPIMYKILDTSHPNPDPTFGIGGNIISAIETGLALMTVCVPDLLPLLKQYVPKLLGWDTSKGTTPMNGYASNLRSAKKSGYIQTDSKNASIVQNNKYPEGYQMDNMNRWERSRTTTGSANAYGGYPSPGSSAAGSEEAIVVVDGKRIVKTTQITIRSLEEGRN